MISFTSRQKPEITRSTTNILRERDETKFVVGERGGEPKRPLRKQKRLWGGPNQTTRCHITYIHTPWSRVLEKL